MTPEPVGRKRYSLNPKDFPAGKPRRAQLPVPAQPCRAEDNTKYDPKGHANPDANREANSDVVEGGA